MILSTHASSCLILGLEASLCGLFSCCSKPAMFLPLCVMAALSWAVRIHLCSADLFKLKPMIPPGVLLSLFTVCLMVWSAVIWLKKMPSQQIQPVSCILPQKDALTEVVAYPTSRQWNTWHNWCGRMQTSKVASSGGMPCEVPSFLLLLTWWSLGRAQTRQGMIPRRQPLDHDMWLCTYCKLQASGWSVVTRSILNSSDEMSLCQEGFWEIVGQLHCQKTSPAKFQSFTTSVVEGLHMALLALTVLL